MGFHFRRFIQVVCISNISYLLSYVHVNGRRSVRCCKCKPCPSAAASKPDRTEPDPNRMDGRLAAWRSPSNGATFPCQSTNTTRDTHLSPYTFINWSLCRMCIVLYYSWLLGYLLYKFTQYIDKILRDEQILYKYCTVCWPNIT